MPPTSTGSSTKKATNRVDIKAFIKESRAKKRQIEKDAPAVEGEGDDSIAMCEPSSASTSYSRLLRANPLPLEMYFTLICRDDAVFNIPMSIAKELGCVRTLLATESFKEAEKKELHLREHDGDVVEKVIQFCFEDSIFNPTSREKKETAKPSAFVSDEDSQKDSRVVFLFSLSPDVVMDIMMTAHFLQVPRLVDIASKMLADNFMQITSIEGIPDDIVLNILRYLTPEFLVVAESMAIIKNLPIDVQKLWKSHFEKKKWLVEVSQCLGSAENATVEDELSALGFSLQSVIPHPDDNVQDITTYNYRAIKESAPLDWRQLFLETDLDNKIRLYHLSIHDDKVILFSDNDEDEEHDEDVDRVTRKRARFLDYISNCSRAIRKIKLPDSVDETFVKNAKSGTFIPIPDIEFTIDILSRLAHLRQLDMSGHKNLARSPEKAKLLCDCVASNMPNLRSFRFSKVSLTAAVCNVLAQTLLAPQNSNFKLRSLDLSESNMPSEALFSISSALATNTTLWAFYMSDNKFTDTNQEKGLASLFSVLGTNKNIALRILDIGGNRSIRFDEMRRHSDCLELFSQNTSITHLFFSAVLKGSKDCWGCRLPKILPSSIQFLDLSSNRFSAVDFTQLFEALKERTLASPDFRLTALDISDSSLHDEALQKLIEWILVNPWLSSLGLRSCFVGDTQGELLASAIRQRAFSSPYRPLSVLCLDINNLGRSAIHITQAYVSQLPDPKELALILADQTNLVFPQLNLLSITRNPIFTHYVPLPLPPAGEPIATTPTVQEVDDENVDYNEKMAQDVRLRSGVRIEALFRTDAVRKKDVRLVV